MTRKYIRFVIAIIGCLVLFLFFAQEIRRHLINGLWPSHSINESTSEFGGLRISVRKVVQDGSNLRIMYALEWTERRTDEPIVVLTRPWTLAVLQFINGDGILINQIHSEWITVDNAFYRGSSSVYEGEITLVPPTEARAVLINVNGLTTKPFAIPSGYNH